MRRIGKGISPVLATLILIVIAVVVGIIVFAWISGWMGGQFGAAREDLRIEGVSVSHGYVKITVKNVGTVKATVDKVSIDDLPSQPVGVDIEAGQVKTISVAYAWTYKERYHVKLWTTRGLVLEGDYAADPETAYALQFDGTNDYVLLPEPMNSFPSDSLTLEAWVRGYGVVFDEQGSGAPSSGWHDAQIEILSNGTVRMAVWPYSYVLDCGEVSTSTWNHLALTYDASTGELKGYVNGELRASRSGVTRESSGATTYVIGHGDSTNLGEGDYFNGLIDDVRIYNRALSEAEVRNNYRGSITTDGLVLWLRFDEGSGDTAYDASGNGNDGTIYGATWYEPGITQDVVSTVYISLCLWVAPAPRAGARN